MLPFQALFTAQSAVPGQPPRLAAAWPTAHDSCWDLCPYAPAGHLALLPEALETATAPSALPLAPAVLPRSSPQDTHVTERSVELPHVCHNWFHLTTPWEQVCRFYRSEWTIRECKEMCPGDRAGALDPHAVLHSSPAPWASQSPLSQVLLCKAPRLPVKNARTLPSGSSQSHPRVPRGCLPCTCLLVHPLPLSAAFISAPCSPRTSHLPLTAAARAVPTPQSSFGAYLCLF